MLLKFTGIDNQEAAETLQKKLLLIAPNDQPELRGDAEFYASQLISMQVNPRPLALLWVVRMQVSSLAVGVGSWN